MVAAAWRTPAVAAQADRVAYASLIACAVVAPLGMAPQEITVVLAILAWLIGSITGRKPLMDWRLHAPLIVWFLIACLSLVNASDLSVGLSGLKKMLKAGTFFLAVAATIQTRQRLTAVLSAMMVGASVVSFDGLWQVTSGADLFYRRPAGGGLEGIARLMATFGHPNDYAVYAVTVLPVCLMMALPSMTLKERGWSWVAVALVGISLPLTFSRPAVVALAASLTVFIFLRKAWKALAMVAAIIMLALVWLPDSVKVWVSQQPSWLHVVAQPLRFEIWQAALNMIAVHPWLGIGANLFVHDYALYRIAGDTLQSAYGHNHYLQMAAEIGLLGLSAFVWFLFASFRIWRQLLAGRQAWVRHAATGLGCGIIAFLAMGLLESALQSGRCNVIFWLWMGVLHGLWLGQRGLDSKADAGV